MKFFCPLNLNEVTPYSLATLKKVIKISDKQKRIISGLVNNAGERQRIDFNNDTIVCYESENQDFFDRCETEIIQYFVKLLRVWSMFIQLKEEKAKMVL